jgi:hypothetical protein
MPTFQYNWEPSIPTPISLDIQDLAQVEKAEVRDLEIIDGRTI